ncbi:hypothetical protein ABK040_010113 [Willaertia magna]
MQSTQANHQSKNLHGKSPTNVDGKSKGIVTSGRVIPFFSSSYFSPKPQQQHEGKIISAPKSISSTSSSSTNSSPHSPPSSSPPTLTMQYQQQHYHHNKPKERLERTFAMVGCNSGGKSTITKSLRKIYNKPFTKLERTAFRDQIYSNILTSFRILVKQSLLLLNNYEKDIDFLRTYFMKNKVLDLHSEQENDFNEIYFKKQIEELKNKLLKDEILLNQLGVDLMSVKQYKNLFTKLFKDELIQRIYLMRNKTYHLPDLDYWMKHLKRITSSNFTPTTEDILNTRIPTSGISTSDIYLDEVYNINFMVYDIAGERTERIKLFKVMDEITDLIYVIALDEFDMVCFEDTTMNQLTESINMFKFLCEKCKEDFVKNGKPLKRIFLVLNKFDVFNQKISEDGSSSILTNDNKKIINRNTLATLELNHPEIFTNYGSTNGSMTQAMRSIIEFFIKVYDSYFYDLRNFTISKDQYLKYKITSPSLCNSLLNVCITSAVNMTSMKHFWEYLISGKNGIEQWIYRADLGYSIPIRLLDLRNNNELNLWITWGENLLISSFDFPEFSFSLHHCLLALKCPELYELIKKESKLPKLQQQLKNNDKSKNNNTLQDKFTYCVLSDINLFQLNEILIRINLGEQIIDLINFINLFENLLEVDPFHRRIISTITTPLEIHQPLLNSNEKVNNEKEGIDNEDKKKKKSKLSKLFSKIKDLKKKKSKDERQQGNNPILAKEMTILYEKFRFDQMLGPLDISNNNNESLMPLFKDNASFENMFVEGNNNNEGQKSSRDSFDVLLYHQARDPIQAHRFIMSRFLPGYSANNDYYSLIPFLKYDSYFHVIRMIYSSINFIPPYESYEPQLNMLTNNITSKQYNANDPKQWMDLIEMFYISKMWGFEEGSLLITELMKQLNQFISPRNVVRILEFVSVDRIEFSFFMEKRIQEKKFIQSTETVWICLLDDLPADLLYHISTFIYGTEKSDILPTNQIINQDLLSLCCSLSEDTYFKFLHYLLKNCKNNFALTWQTRHISFSRIKQKCLDFIVTNFEVVSKESSWIELEETNSLKQMINQLVPHK